jgi:hypothetical protein
MGYVMRLINAPPTSGQRGVDCHRDAVRSGATGCDHWRRSTPQFNLPLTGLARLPKNDYVAKVFTSVTR